MQNKAKRKKILFLITLSSMGGAQRYVFDLATHLDQERFSVSVAAGPEGNGALLRLLIKNGVSVFPLRYLIRRISLYHDIRAYWELRNLFRRERADIVHLNSSKASILGSLAARHAHIKRVVYTVHGSVFEARFPYFLRYAFRLAEKIMSRWKDSVITVTERDRILWGKFRIAPREKLITIYPGINPAAIRFFNKEEAHRRLAGLLGIPADTEASFKFVGSIAHLFPEKGIEYFLAAAAILRKRFPDVRFFVIGEGPERKRLQDILEKYGLADVFFLPGMLPDAARLLRGFDVFVLASTKEGLPYTLLEAVASGIPIVATDAGGVPEIFFGDEGAILVPARHVGKLARSIEKSLNAQTSVSFLPLPSLPSRFTLSHMVSRTETVYDGILSHHY